MKNDGDYMDFQTVVETSKLVIERRDEQHMLFKRLETDGYISAHFFIGGEGIAKITSRGIDYCESDSYSYEGKPLITNNYNFNIENSTGVALVTSSSNVHINQTFGTAIQEKFDALLRAVEEEIRLDQSQKQDIKDCVTEIKEAIANNLKPRFSYKALLEMTSSFAGIGSLVLEIGKLIFM